MFNGKKCFVKRFLGVVLIIMILPSFGDVTLYGRIIAAVENDSFPSNTQSEPGSTSLQEYPSYFGIRGTDQVYGQTAVIWQVEQQLNITSGEAYQGTAGKNWTPNHPGVSTGGVNSTNTNVLASSDSYIGLQGGWGRVRIGNLSNTFRTNTGAVDIFNGSNANALRGVNGVYDRFLQILPQTIRYDSPAWQSFSLSAYYSFNQDGNYNTGGANGDGMNQAGDMNGANNNGIYGVGLFYKPGSFSATWNTMFEQNSGIYQSIQNGGSTPGQIGKVSAQEGINAWVSRLEFSYNDPDSWFAGVGGQISQGFGYFSVPGNGDLNNIWILQQSVGNVNSQYYGRCTGGWCPLNQAVLDAAEAGFSFGWHIENWTPKIGHTYGSNMMTGGTPWDIIGGNNQIGGTGYQHAIVELDWNITPRTIAFINSGEIWWGNTAQSMHKGTNPGVCQAGSTSCIPTTSMNQAGGSIWINNISSAIGLSHTF